MSTGPHHRMSLEDFAVRAAVAVGIACGLAILLAVAYLVVDVLLLLFAGILLALFLRGGGDWLARHSFLSPGWSVFVVTLSIAALLGAVTWAGASIVLAQADVLVATLPKAVQRLQQHLLAYPWANWLISRLNEINWASRRIDYLGRVTGAVSSVFGSIANIVIICFVGFYLAVRPDLYLEGFLHLVPVNGRPRARQVLGEQGRVLRWWLLATMFNMAVIGGMSGLGLWLLNIQFPLVLGLLAGMLAFIPYLGAIAAAVPAVLIAVITGPEHALYVGLLYLGVHFVEGYLLTPLVQQYAVSLAPALLLCGQIMLGVLLGPMGIMLAAPIAATMLVAVRMLYVHDLVGDETGNSGK